MHQAKAVLTAAETIFTDVPVDVSPGCVVTRLKAYAPAASDVNDATQKRLQMTLTLIRRNKPPHASLSRGEGVALLSDFPPEAADRIVTLPQLYDWLLQAGAPVADGLS